MDGLYETYGLYRDVIEQNEPYTTTDKSVRKVSVRIKKLQLHLIPRSP